jgi:outer membrane protein assembly factor BamA
MIQKKIIAIIIVLNCFLGSILCQTTNNDSTLIKSRTFLVPFVDYQPETKFATGVSFGYYFKSYDPNRISSIMGSAFYSFEKHHYLFEISPKIYFKSSNWFLNSNLNIRKYPYYYYGIGNTIYNYELPFTSENIAVKLEPQYAVSSYFSVGPTCSFRYERVNTDEDFELIKDYIFAQYGSAGWKRYTNLSVGMIATYDKRNNPFYPEKGVFVTSHISTSSADLGSTYSLFELLLDFRQYIPVLETHVWSYQLYYNSIFGKKDGIPFQLMPTIGGNDFLRGFRHGMFRDNTLFMVQSEYRFPIIKVLNMAVFGGLGDVTDNNDYKIDKLKLAYGLGLQYGSSKDKLLFRFDVAKNNYNNDIQFYFTASQSF